MSPLLHLGAATCARLGLGQAPAEGVGHVTTPAPQAVAPDAVAYRTSPSSTVAHAGLWQGALKIARALTVAVGVGAALGGCVTQASVVNDPMGAGIAASAVVRPARMQGHADGKALAQRFEILSPAASVKAVDSAYHATNGIRVGTQIEGKTFSDEEMVSLRDVTATLQPIWRCGNAREVRLARVDYLVHGRDEVNEKTAGVTFASFGLIGLADSSRIPGGDYATVGVFTHELAHLFLQYANPITCTNYNDANENPMMRDYIAMVEAHGGQRINDYGATNWLEDMAESFRMYMTRRDLLARRFPERVEFFNAVFARLKVAPPQQIDEYKAPQLNVG